jgi:uncharacterized protein YodC (DUF2158 family)
MTFFNRHAALSLRVQHAFLQNRIPVLRGMLQAACRHKSRYRYEGERAVFEPGDVVMLKSGGHSMTVVSVSEDEITCLWTSDAGQLFREAIPSVALEAIYAVHEDGEDEEDDEDEEDEEEEEEEEANDKDQGKSKRKK